MESTGGWEGVSEPEWAALGGVGLLSFLAARNRQSAWRGHRIPGRRRCAGPWDRPHCAWGCCWCRRRVCGQSWVGGSVAMSWRVTWVKGGLLGTDLTRKWNCNLDRQRGSEGQWGGWGRRGLGWVAGSEGSQCRNCRARIGEGLTHRLQRQREARSSRGSSGTYARVLPAPRSLLGLLRVPLLTPELLKDKLGHIQNFKSLSEQKLNWIRQHPL